MMLALMEEIKNTVTLLGNDPEPEDQDLQMRACMGITVVLMKELRNTIVESEQYSEKVTSRASQALAECRTQLGLLYRKVPCHAEGCPVTAEVQRYFLQVMNDVIVAFDYLIEESLSNRNSRDPNPQSDMAAHRGLMLFRKLTSKRKCSERRRKTELDPRDCLEAELREAELELGKIREKNEQLKSSLTALKSKYRALRSDVGKSAKRSNLFRKLRVKIRLSRNQIPKCRSKWRQAEPLWLPEREKESKAKLTAEIPDNLRVPASSTSSELLLKDLAELSNVAMVGSYQNMGSKDLQVLWVQKDQHKFQPKCASSDFRSKALTQLESKSNVVVVGSLENIESESSLQMENSQDLQVLWLQEGKSCIPTSSPSLDSVFKHLPLLPLLKNDKSPTSLTTESQQDLQVLWERKEKPMDHTRFTSSHLLFKDMPQNDGSATHFKIDCLAKEQSLIQTVSTFSDFLPKHLPQAESVASQPSLKTESPQELPVQRSFTSSHLRFMDKPQNDGSKRNFKTDDLPVEPFMIQTVSTSFDLLFKDLLQQGKIESQTSWQADSWQDLQLIQIGSTSANDMSNVELPKPEIDESQTSLTTESSQDLQLIKIGSASSKDILIELPKPEVDERQTSLTADSWQDLQLIQIGSTSSNDILTELPKPEVDESQTSLKTEHLQDLQGLCVQKGLTSSDFLLKNLTSDTALVGYIQNIESPTSLRMESGQDLGVLQFQKENSSSQLQTSSNSSNFIVEDKPQNDKSQPSLMVNTPENVQVWRSQMEQHMSQTSSSSSDFILKNLKELESNMALAGSILSVQSNSSLSSLSREDLPVPSFQKNKPPISTSFTYSDLLLKDLLYPEKVEAKTCLTSKSLPQLKVLLAGTDKPKATLGSSSADVSVKKINSWTKGRQVDKPKTPSNATLKNIVSAKKPSPNTSQLSMTSKKSNSHRDTKKLKPTTSYFSVGKTFGDHRLRLLRWCQEKTKKYGVPMYEFSESWRSGRALVAIIYSYRKDLIEERFNPNRFIRESPRDILICGAKAAKSLGLNSKVDIVRVCQQKVPDFCKVFTFVSELHRCLEKKFS